MLVTGATGFIGLEVCRVLSQAGIPTRAMFRRRHRGALLGPLGVDLVFGDLTSPASIDRAVQGCRAVIHLGGRATFEPIDRLRPTLVDGTRNLVEACERHGVGRIVFGSSLLVHGPSDGLELTSASPTHPVIDYGQAKLEAEAVLAHSGAVSALSIRLPHVYGWNDLLFGILRSRLLPFPADLDARFPHMHVTDAALALIAAVDQSVTGPLPIADDLTVTWRHFFEVIETYLPEVQILAMPAKPIELALRVADRLPLRKPTMLASDTIRGWNLDLTVPPETMKQLHLQCRYPTIETGIPAVLDESLPYRWRHPLLDRRNG